MTRYTISLIALTLAVAGSAASAQEVITNPGKCAQFYPNANCENYGPGNPYRGPNSYQQERNGWGYGTTTGSGYGGGTRGQINRGSRGDRYGYGAGYGYQGGYPDAEEAAPAGR